MVFRLIRKKMQPALAYKNTHMYTNTQNIDHMHITTIVLSCMSYETMSTSSYNTLRTILKLHMLLNALQRSITEQYCGLYGSL